MSIPFPSMDFFEALQRGLAANRAGVEDVEPSNAYCGLAIDDSLFVLEFEGRECSAIAPNGNALDLDFVLAASGATWREVISAIVENGGADPDHTLSALVESGAVEIQSAEEDGADLAHAAFGILQAFLDEAKTVDTCLD
jgi:hypothetical protein